MSYKIHLIDYIHNSNVSIDEILSGIDVFENDYRVDFCFYFHDYKYLDVLNGSICCKDYEGPVISFTPFIYDGKTCLNDLDADKIDVYYNHPKYFRIEFVLPKCFKNYDIFVTPLKWEYCVSIINGKIGKMINCSDIEIIDHT